MSLFGIVLSLDVFEPSSRSPTASLRRSVPSARVTGHCAVRSRTAAIAAGTGLERSPPNPATIKNWQAPSGRHPPRPNLMPNIESQSSQRGVRLQLRPLRRPGVCARFRRTIAKAEIAYFSPHPSTFRVWRRFVVTYHNLRLTVEQCFRSFHPKKPGPVERSNRPGPVIPSARPFVESALWSKPSVDGIGPRRWLRSRTEDVGCPNP